MEQYPPAQTPVDQNVKVNLPAKILNRWKNLSLVFRLFIIIFTLVFLVIITFFVLSKTKKPEPKKSTPSTTQTLQNDGFTKLVLGQREPAFFTLEPNKNSKFGLPLEDSFTLTAKNSVDAQFIKDNLETTVQMTIAENGNNKLVLTPQAPLTTDQVVGIKLAVKNKEIGGHTFDRNYSWSYQTQGDFRIVSYLPADQKTNVPINTGIEITFSQDDYENADKFISIEPNIQYRLERHAETLAIIPLSPLSYESVYKVTLKKGLKLTSRNDQIDEDFSFSFQTASAQEVKQKPVMVLDKSFLQANTKEPLILKVITSNWKDDTIKAKIYQFPDSSSFINTRKPVDKILNGWYHYFPEQNEVSIDGLSLVSEADLTVQAKEAASEYYQLKYLQLPEALPTGFYFVQFLYNDGQSLQQLWLQVTDLSGYVAVGEKQTTIWVNKLDDGQPAGEVNIQLVGGGETFNTNDQGVAVFNTPTQINNSKSQYFQITSSDNKILLLPALINEKSSQPRSQDYWSYIYHERDMYKSDDTVYFWGVVKNRESSEPVNAKVIITSSSQYYGSEKASVLFSQNIYPDENGAFFGSINFADLPPGWYSLSLQIGETTLDSSSFKVIDYVKPEIKIEVETPKKAVFAGETVEFTAKVSFYDETPASNITLNIFETNGGQSSQVQTDSQGIVKYSYTTKYDEYAYRSSTIQSYQCVTFSPPSAQEAKIEGQGCLTVFSSKLVLDIESDQQKDQASIKATVNNVDLDKYNKNQEDGYVGTPAKDVKVAFKTAKKWQERVENGTYYDYVEKVTKPSYRYVSHSEDGPGSEQTTDDNGEVSFQYQLEEKKSYETAVSVVDQDNHENHQTAYFYYNSDISSYEIPASTNPELTIDTENPFALNEEVGLTIKIGDENYPDNDKNRFLYILAERGYQEAFVQDQPHMNFNFSEKYIPNVYAGAVIFTGSSYQIVLTPCKWNRYCYYSYFYQQNSFPGLNIQFKEDERKLDLTIGYDKSSYQPGDKASVVVTVEDKDKQKVSNVDVNLILVDEALSAIGGVIEPSIMEDLYQDVSMDIYYSYHSHEPIFPPESQAEMGGGGGGDRDLFKDTAFFGQAKTNAEGQAVFNFTLPDNITSWLVYAQGVNQNLQAGQQENTMIVSKDFFVLPGFLSEFLAKDQPILTASAFGKGLNETSSVDFEAGFYQNETEISKAQKKAPAFKFTSFPFPQLSSGTYKMSLAGKSGDLDDKVILPFNVIDSRFSMKQDIVKKLTAGQSFTASKIDGLLSQKPVTLVVSDEGKGKYYWSLLGFCYQNSNRLEKNLARNAAGEILKDYFDSDVCPQNTVDLTKFQNSDGGLGQVNWGASNLYSTIWAIYVDAEAFDKEKLTDYLETQFNQQASGTVQKIQSAWGLTSLGKPEIIALQNMADFATSFEEKVYAALGLATAGETEKAREIYYDILTDYAYEHKPYIRIQAPTQNQQNNNSASKDDQFLKDTAMTLLLGKLVEPEYNDGLYAYIRDYRYNAEDVVLDLDEMAFIKQYLQEVPKESTSLQYKSSSRELAKEMKYGGSWALDISPNEQNNYQLQVVSGKAEAVLGYYVGSEGLKTASPDNRLSLKRTYKKTKGSGDGFYPGNIVRINLTFDIDEKESPQGCGYKVTDILPSGFIYLNNPGSYGLSSRDWAETKDNKVLSFGFCNSPWWFSYHGKTFTYFARVAVPGTYFAEPAIMQSGLDPSVFTYTDSQEVKIEPRE